jgi:hypothetical protein
LYRCWRQEASNYWGTRRIRGKPRTTTTASPRSYELTMMAQFGCRSRTVICLPATLAQPQKQKWREAVQEEEVRQIKNVRKMRRFRQMIAAISSAIFNGISFFLPCLIESNVSPRPAPTKMSHFKSGTFPLCVKNCRSGRVNFVAAVIIYIRRRAWPVRCRHARPPEEVTEDNGKRHPDNPTNRNQHTGGTRTENKLDGKVQFALGTSNYGYGYSGKLRPHIRLMLASSAS